MGLGVRGSHDMPLSQGNGQETGVQYELGSHLFCTCQLLSIRFRLFQSHDILFAPTVHTCTLLDFISLQVYAIGMGVFLRWGMRNMAV